MPDLPALSARVPLLGWIFRLLRWRLFWRTAGLTCLVLPLLLGLLLFWREWRDPAFTLRAVDLPYSWEEAGYRGPALATQLSEQFAQLQAQSQARQPSLATLDRTLPLRLRSEAAFPPNRWRNAIAYARQRLTRQAPRHLNLAILAGPDSVRLLVQRPGHPGPHQTVAWPLPPTPVPTQAWIDQFMAVGLLAIAAEADPVWGAWLAWTQDQPAQAYELARQALAATEPAPRRAWASLLLGHLAGAGGRYAVALDYYQQAEEAGLRGASLWLARAEAHEGLGQVTAADSAFARAVRPAHSRAQALAQWAAYLDRRGEPEAAAARYAEAAIADPASVPILLAWAQHLQRAGLSAAAREKYEHALALAPGEPAVSAAFGAMLAAEGQALEAAQRPLPALERYLRRWELEPTHPAARQPLARALGLATPPLAVPWDSLPQPWTQRLVGAGLACAADCFAQNNPATGERWLEALAQHVPHDDRIRQEHARWLWTLISDSVAAGHFAGAHRRYRQLLQLQPPPSSQSQQLALAVEAQADRQLAAQAWAAAEQGYALLDALDHLHVVHLLGWAQAREALGDWAGAEHCYTRAYQMQVDLAAVVAAWADMLARQRVYDRAWEKFALAHQLAPEDASIAMRWGDALLAAGLTLRAEEAYTAAWPRLDGTGQSLSAFRRDKGRLAAQMGYCAQVRGDYAAREAYYGQADSLAQQLIEAPLAGDDPAAGHYLRAMLAGHQRRAAELEQTLDEALALGWPAAAVSREAEPFRRFPVQVERVLGRLGE